MRDILFKAKRIDNGEWVYGNYAFTDVCGGHHFIFQNKAFEHEVDANTICQYTGLTDKNGQKIWENDCIGHRLNVVEFLDGYWCVNGDRPLWMVAKDWEVIGNIFDNPELLKGGGAE